MTESTAHTSTNPSDVVDWTDLGREMWSFLTGREAAINYRFIDMAVEVPRDTGAQARHLEAQWHPAGHHEGQRKLRGNRRLSRWPLI